MKAPTFVRRPWRWLKRSCRAVIVRLERTTGARGDLRQFVYLDEVALRSLMAARYGAEEVRILETSARGRETGISAEATHAVPAVSSTKAGGRYQTSVSKSRQVERQTTVQSIFKEFLSRETGRLRWDSETEVRPDAVSRGDLVQLRVRLAPDPNYQVSAIITLFSDLNDDLPESRRINFGDIGTLSALLEQLMVGQIPLKSEIVTKERLPAERDESRLPLYLVGTTEIDQYWTDTRRVLFGEQEFLALVRVTVAGPTRSWSPIKAFDMMRKIPGMTERIDEWASFESLLSGRENFPETARDVTFAEGLIAYAESIGVPTDDPRLLPGLAPIVNDLGPRLPSYVAVGEALDRVDSWWRKAGGKVPSGDAVTARKVNAAAQINKASATPMEPTLIREEALYLEGEVVAIYW